jgi:hypothetical protein
MTESKHTPGQWRAKFSGGTITKTHILSDDQRYASGMFGVAHVFGENQEQERANANLMAAAPDLLKELRELVEICEQVAPHIIRKRDLNRCKAVIAKAEGQL